eukprot:11906237-Ditylum_brightwellii.AAC.1
MEWLDPISNTVKHCNTAQFDEYYTHVGTDKPMPGALFIGGKLIAEKNLPILTINTSDHPYFVKPPKLFQVPLPLKGRPLGLEISECDYYLLTFIIKSKAGFPFHKHISSDYRNNSWILSINNIKPNSAENTISIFRPLQQKRDNFTVNIYLAKRD